MLYIKSIERKITNITQDLSTYYISNFITIHGIAEGKGVASSQRSPQVFICNGHRIQNFNINCFIVQIIYIHFFFDTMQRAARSTPTCPCVFLEICSRSSCSMAITVMLCYVDEESKRERKEYVRIHMFTSSSRFIFFLWMRRTSNQPNSFGTPISISRSNQPNLYSPLLQFGKFED